MLNHQVNGIMKLNLLLGSGVTAVGWCRTTLRNTDNPTTGGGIVYRPANGDYLDLAGNNPSSKPTTSAGAGQIIQVAIDLRWWKDLVWSSWNLF